METTSSAPSANPSSCIDSEATHDVALLAARAAADAAKLTEASPSAAAAAVVDAYLAALKALKSGV